MGSPGQSTVADVGDSRRSAGVFEKDFAVAMSDRDLVAVGGDKDVPRAVLATDQVDDAGDGEAAVAG